MSPLSVIVVASVIISLTLIPRIWQGKEPKFFRFLLTVVTLIPVLGPIACLWILNWPPDNPWWLDGRGAGRGSRYLDAEISRKRGGQSIDQFTEAFLANEWAHGKLRKRKTKHPRHKRRVSRDPSKYSPGWYFAGLLVGAWLLGHYWLLFFVMYRDGNVWGYQNYWGGDVGIYLLLAILLAATPTYFVAAWRFWPRTGRGKG